MDNFIQFDLERWQGDYENTVTHNLAESGVSPLTTGELLEISRTDPAELHRVRLGYSQTNGTDELRERIAALYPGATADNVLVTIGSAEANFATAWTMAASRGRIAVQVPVYKQMWGVVQNLGAEAVEFHLDPEAGWVLDSASATRAITPDTKCVIVTDPNNPTGHVMGPDERNHIRGLVDEAGAWLVVDEVYRGAEMSGPETPSWWIRNDRTVVTGGLSKAYGLPGLRLGWVVGPPSFIRDVTQRHDYLVIGPAAISDFLAIRALGARDAILARTRQVMNRNYALLDAWRADLEHVISWAPPVAGAMVFARYRLSLDSNDLAEHLRTEHSTLVVPGAHFDHPGYLRLGFGEDPDDLAAALAVAGQGLRDLISD